MKIFFSVGINHLIFNPAKKQFKKQNIQTNFGNASLVLIAFIAFFFASCNGNNNVITTTDTLSQKNLQRVEDGNGEDKIYQGMAMVKSGTDMIAKGERSNDRAIINNGSAIMNKGMDMVISGREMIDKGQATPMPMDNNDGVKRNEDSKFSKDMDMNDYGMNLIHQGIYVAKSGKEITEKSQKNADKAMMQTGMDMMDKGMAMMKMGKEMMGKDSATMVSKGTDSGMGMIDQGMDMMDMGKAMAGKAMDSTKKMVDDKMMDKGMGMMDKGMDMMDMCCGDKMKDDKMNMKPMTNDTMKKAKMPMPK